MATYIPHPIPWDSQTGIINPTLIDALFRIKHPNIVEGKGIFPYSERGPEVTVLRKETLPEVITNGAWNISHRLMVFSQLINAGSYLHSQNLSLGHITLSNIYFNSMKGTEWESLYRPIKGTEWESLPIKGTEWNGQIYPGNSIHLNPTQEDIDQDIQDLGSIGIQLFARSILPRIDLSLIDDYLGYIPIGIALPLRNILITMISNPSTTSLQQILKDELFDSYIPESGYIVQGTPTSLDSKMIQYLQSIVKSLPPNINVQTLILTLNIASRLYRIYPTYPIYGQVSALIACKITQYPPYFTPTGQVLRGELDAIVKLNGILNVNVLNSDQLNRIQQDLGWQLYYLRQVPLSSPNILNYHIYMAKSYNDLTPYQVDAMYDLLSRDCFPGEDIGKRWYGRTYWIEDGNRIIAMANALEAKYYNFNFKWLIANVCVASNKRGERLARYLLTLVLNDLSQTDREAYLEVWEDNIPAYRTYTNLGFVPVEKEVKQFKGQPRTMVLMRKEL